MLSDLTKGLHLGILFITLFTSLMAYFRAAEYYGIIDIPNERSSHRHPTIRGGGIVFVLALLSWWALYRLEFPYFLASALLVGVVSFIDDIASLPSIVRFVVQVVAFGLISWQVGLYLHPLWLWALIFIISVGTLNAFNFMDGINGMTGVYGFVALITFYYINNHIIHFGHTSLIVFMLVAVFVFLFFNFRLVARCFAGDVGAVTLGFVIIFLLLQLILETYNFNWALMLLVYGLDSVMTIVYRLRRRENIFAAHRTHLYQYLTNEMGANPLWVSVSYGLAQLVVNILLVGVLANEPWWCSVLVVLVTGGGYVLIREKVLASIGRPGLFA